MPRSTRLHWGLLLAATGAAVIQYCTAIAREQSPNLGNLLVHIVKPISSEKILPDTFPLPGQRSTNINIKACRGEYEPASFVIRTGTEGVTGLLPVATDLISATGHRIPKENIDIKLVKVWYQSGGAWESVERDAKKAPTLVPELLINDPELVKLDLTNKRNWLKVTSRSGSTTYQDISSPESGVKARDPIPAEDLRVKDADGLQPANIAAETTQQYWITLQIPKTAPAEQYTGTLDITNNNGSIGTLSLSVTVNPFDLVPPKLEYSIYYRGFISDDGQPSISSEEKSRDQLKHELTDILQHGITNPTILQRYFGNNDHKLQLFKDYLFIRRQLGITDSPIYYLGRPTYNHTDKEHLDELTSNLQDILKILKKTNSNLFVYGMDEAKGDKLKSQKAAWDAVHKIGAKIFVAGTRGHFEAMGRETDLLIFLGHPDRNEAKKFHEVGNKIFSYANPQGGVENPLIYRRNYGVTLWSSDFDGAMTYAYQDTEGSIWNDFDQRSPYRDHVLAYPTLNGVIDTIAWEGFREAVDDVRYLSTLETLLLHQNNENANVARTYLTNIREAHPKDLDEMRATLAAHISAVTN